MEIGLIFKNTFQKEWRNKTLIFLLILTVVIVTLASLALFYFKENVLENSPMQGLARGSLGAFFWIVNIWSYLIATYIGVGAIRTDFENGTISQMLSFPISRFEYFVGRLAGAYSIVTGYYLISMMICLIGVSSAMGEVLLSPSLLVGIFITSLSNLVVITMAMMIALYLSTIKAFIVNFILTLIVGAANSYFISEGVKKAMEEFSILKGLGLIFHLLLPHFSHWESWGKSFILENDFKFDYMMEIPHFLVTYTLLGFLTNWAFKKRDI